MRHSNRIRTICSGLHQDLATVLWISVHADTTVPALAGSHIQYTRCRRAFWAASKEAWVVDYRDKTKGGARVLRTFRLKKEGR